jgi:MFS family permease
MHREFTVTANLDPRFPGCRWIESIHAYPVRQDSHVTHSPLLGTTILDRLGMLSALRHRDFRLYWFGFVSSVSGMQIFIVAQAWLVFDLTGSALDLGLLGLARAVPAIFLGLAGGVIADKIDQRRLIIVTSTITGVLYAVLATLTVTGVVEVWHILAATFLIAAVQALDQPSRQAIFPHLIDRKDMTKAVGMNSTIHPGTRIYGPIVAGLMIDFVGAPRFGAGIAIYVAAATYIVFTYMMYRVRLPAGIQRATGRNPFQDLKDGMSFIRTTHLFRLLIAMSFVHAAFGMAHITILPVFAERLTGEATGSTLALLFSATGLGGLIGAVLGGSLANVRQRGWLIVGGGGGFGTLLIAFAFAPIYLFAIAFELLASVSNQVFMVVAQSALHGQVPDEYRGRVMGVWGLTHSLLQPMGGLGMGATTGLLGAPMVTAVGGGVVIVFAAMVGRSREVRHLGITETPAESSDPPAVPTRA